MKRKFKAGDRATLRTKEEILEDKENFYADKNWTYGQLIDIESNLYLPIFYDDKIQLGKEVQIDKIYNEDGYCYIIGSNLKFPLTMFKEYFEEENKYAIGDVVKIKSLKEIEQDTENFEYNDYYGFFVETKSGIEVPDYIGENGNITTTILSFTDDGDYFMSNHRVYTYAMIKGYSDEKVEWHEENEDDYEDCCSTLDLEATTHHVETEDGKIYTVYMMDASGDRRRFCIGDEFIHFKGNHYQLIGLAKSVDDKPKDLVIYKSLYGDNQVWVRELDEFFSKVDKGKYPDCPFTYRFQRI